jgi:hypothetical protein
MKECDKRNSHINSKLRMIYTSTNNGRHPVTKTFNTLHQSIHFSPLRYIFRHFSFSHLNFTQPHFTTVPFGLTSFKFPTVPFHLTSLHFSLHSVSLFGRFTHQDRTPVPTEALFVRSNWTSQAIRWSTVTQAGIYRRLRHSYTEMFAACNVLFCSINGRKTWYRINITIY